MKPIIALTFLLPLSSAFALWPIPRTLETGTETLWLSPDIKVSYELPTNCPSRSKLQSAWTRTRQHLFRDNIVPWKFHPRHASFEPTYTRHGLLTELVITQHSNDPKLPKVESLKEAYNLTIPSSGGRISLEADTSLGVLHGLNTLSQIFYAASDRGAFGSVYTTSAPITIRDSPVFPHRGLNLDVARQWYDVDTIKKVIASLAWNKFNVLHLHVTDSQSWPLEVPALPELAQKGSYAKGLTYSPADVQGILAFAEERGVQVIVEIDMPGHTTSIAEAYPELIVGKNIQPNWDTYAAQPPSGSFKLNNPAVETFLTKLFGDVLPRLNKHSPYFHSGGDEVNANIYELDPGVGSNDPPTIQPALQRFFTHVQKQLHKHDMTPIVWEEMLLDWNLTISKDTIIQTWLSDESVKKAAAAGHRVVAGNYNYWYLDCGQGQWLDLSARFAPYSDWCAPRKSWRLVYEYDPVQGLSESEAEKVIGGEVHVWSEQIDRESVDVMLWPRASAAGEVLWSGRKDAGGKNRTFADASMRLGEMRERMVKRGTGGSPVMQLWCHQNEGGCQLE